MKHTEREILEAMGMREQDIKKHIRDGVFIYDSLYDYEQSNGNGVTLKIFSISKKLK